ncbi:Regulator of G protein signaling superfamily [Penicillium manginii]|uniref:Regulator of G protein signaling superfamily n=1 Tax=Penicillium manginii TaxID=203109 RepID=UPI0025469213|nr:Regulator of G protein signaling superfamily [Penicillium manginii]KAJ5751183.1 Regulator of G protein signaling superfamily [Penicillium manginii]
MLKKKSLSPSFFWNSTPSTTPELSPTSSDSDSDEDMESSGSRPVSLAVSAGAFCPMRPTLNDVLANTAPPPYTLSAFMAYLSQNHCLETLEFTLEAQRYRDTYLSFAERLGQSTLTTETPESQHLRMLWQRLLTAYIFPGAPREINLSSEVRDGLLRHRDVSLPPGARNPRLSRETHPRSHGGIHLPPLPQRTHHLALNAAHSSTKDLPATGVRSNLSLGAVHALGKRASGALLSTSGESVSLALTDDSSPQSSPTAEEPMTPPTTPPASDANLSMHSPRLRTENPWKKMGMKLGFKKRSGGASGSRGDPKIIGLDY